MSDGDVALEKGCRCCTQFKLHCRIADMRLADSLVQFSFCDTLTDSNICS